MKNHSAALAAIEQQLVEQSSQFREVCEALQSLDARALLPVSEDVLREIDRACSERATVGRCLPLSGLRA